ncbi:MAG: ATP-grasp enzyme [Pseudomonadota bacterium]
MQASKTKSALWLVSIATKDVATLAILVIALPFSLCAVGIGVIFSKLRHRRLSSSVAKQRKTVLISGGKMTKALQLARSFHRAGHRVILCETRKYRWTGHRFSSAVDKFYVVPSPTAPEYAAELASIIEQESVDVYVPVCSPVASYYDSLAIGVLANKCDVIHPRPRHINRLDDKYQFAKAAESCGLAAPKSFFLTDRQQVLDFDFSEEKRSYILKSIRYDSIRRLDLTKLPLPTRQATHDFVDGLPISESNPWVMQEFIPGIEYCTHSTVRNGELRLHCCCESSAFQVNYEHIDDREIFDWVNTFTKGLGLTGQVSFDFIRAHDDGRVYAIECNPRTHSAITTFHDHPDVAKAYLTDEALAEPIVPLPSSRPTHWTYHELWRLLVRLGHPSAFLDRLKTLVSGKDAIFDWRDPLPFLMVHHLQVPALLLADLRALKGWVRIDFNIGKLVQLGGD